MTAPQPAAHIAHDSTICRISAAVLAAALLAAPAASDQVTLAARGEGWSLQDGPLDMALYYIPVEGDLLELTGTYAPRAGGDARRFVMALGDGDAVSFAMPGYREATYRFARTGTTVTASVEVSQRLAEVRP